MNPRAENPFGTQFREFHDKVDRPETTYSETRVGVQQFREQIVTNCTSALEKLKRIGAQWDDVAEQAGNKAGKAGWTFPLCIAVWDLLKLFKRATETDDLDAVFMNLYEDNDRTQFDALKTSLRNSTSLSQWQCLLEECLKSYDQDRYRICIPALFSVLEGLAMEVRRTRVNKTKKTKVCVATGEIEKAIKDQSVQYRLMIAHFSSVNAFADALFTPHKFDQERLPLINRHWVLHGRDLPEQWTRADAMRIFHGIATLAELSTSFEPVDPAGRMRRNVP